MIRFGLRARLAAAGAMALALAACDDRAGRVDAPEPAPLADLSAADDLPYAEPAPVAYRQPSQGYAWAERAYGLQRAVYDTPPDYGFDYEGEEPLAWETEDDWAMYAEPYDDGYRYYYYEPGADHPYFVRDDDYGYGYGAGGVLVAVFDAAGRYLAADTVHRVAPTAGRYYARGQGLRSAASRSRRVQVTDQAWAERAPQVIRTADPWLRAARDDRQWRAWRDRDQDRELRRFEPEATRRAVRTREWREKDDRRQAGLIRPDDDRQRAENDRRGGRENERQAQREARQLAQLEAGRAQAQRLQQTQAEGERRAERQQAQRQQGEQRQQAEQQAAQADRQRQDERQQAQRQQRQQADAQTRQAEQQQRQAQRQAQNQQRRQADQAQRQAERQRRQGEQQQAGQQRQQAQAQARSAEQQAKPAAARERAGAKGEDRGKGKDQGKGRGQDHKD